MTNNHQPPTTNQPPTTIHHPAWRFLEGYNQLDGVHDEMVARDGRAYSFCAPFIESVEALGRHELASRWENAKRTIRDNGVTYNVYGDPQGVDRPWTLDMVPLLIGPDEWTRLERALLQRTQLLNLLLADIYGPQRVLREGLLPPALVLANPAFLRPCHGIAVPRGVHLHLHAIDLGRAPDGQWWALADRTQAPSGAGYALENRIVLSRSFPEAFRDCRVERLASFFRAHRDTVTAMAPARRDTPKVVLLTPGLLNETYFEHAYLARYLGFSLVEGGDLTVRDGRVFIKTLDGLHQVDVIFRRLDDSYCDPLELRADSTLGVAGLVEAVRSGNVAVANALGSSLVQSAAIARYLPALCRSLLGQELLLQSVPARWCGDADDLRYVLEHLERMVIKPTFPVASRQPIFASTLTVAQRTELADEIRAQPALFVGQDELALSTAPVWTGQKPEPRPVVLRTYVAAAGDGFAVMPGGLTRVAASGNTPIVSMQRGGGSKDTWVLTEGAVSTVSLLPPPAITFHRERRSTDLPSRVADNLFWLGRYAERAEHLVRLLRSLVACLTGEDTTEDTHELRTLLHVFVELELLPPRVGERMPLRELERELAIVLFKPGQHMMRQTLDDLRRIATAVRDRLSLDTWRILNQIREDFRLRHGRIQLDDVLAHLNRMITDLAAFSGMEMENMTRGHGWRFLDIGRRLERSVNTSRLLRTFLTADASHHATLGPLLELADSAMTYRRLYFAQPQLAPVLDLLLADASNARSLAFQLEVLTDHVERLPRENGAPSPTREQRLIAHAAACLKEADLDGLARSDGEGNYAPLVALLRTIDDDVRELSDTLTHYYFSHAELRVS